MAFFSPGASFSDGEPSLNLLSDEDVVLAQGPVAGAQESLPGIGSEVQADPIRSPAALPTADQILVARPLPETLLRVLPQPGSVYRLAFEADSAKVALDNGDLVLLFEDGGEILFEDFVALADRDAAPLLEVDGITISSDLLLEQIGLATVLSGQDALPTLETAAAPLQGGGGSRYLDDLETHSTY